MWISSGYGVGNKLRVIAMSCTYSQSITTLYLFACSYKVPEV